MKRIASALFMKTSLFLKSNRLVMPSMALLVILSGLYAVSPVRIADSYAYSMTALMLVMVWVGFSFTDSEDMVSQQLWVLRLKSFHIAYGLDVMVLFVVGIAFSLFSVLYPLLIHLIGGLSLYKTAVTAEQVLVSLPLHIAAAFVGASVGALWHPRLFKDRKVALLLVLFLCVAGFVRVGIHRLLPIAATVTWLFPPMGLPSEWLSGLDAFPPGATVQMLLWFTAYGAVLWALRTEMLARRRFA